MLTSIQHEIRAKRVIYNIIFHKMITKFPLNKLSKSMVLENKSYKCTSMTTSVYISIVYLSISFFMFSPLMHVCPSATYYFTPQLRTRSPISYQKFFNIILRNFFNNILRHFFNNIAYILIKRNTTPNYLHANGNIEKYRNKNSNFITVLLLLDLTVIINTLHTLQSGTNEQSYVKHYTCYIQSGS